MDEYLNYKENKIKISILIVLGGGILSFSYKVIQEELLNFANRVVTNYPVTSTGREEGKGKCG